MTNKTVERSLSEKAVKGALDSLSWSALNEHLDEIRFDAPAFEILLGHLRRSPRLLLKYPNASREIKRGDIYDGLAKYTETKLGAVHSDKIAETRNMFAFIEAGYRGILRMLDKCDVARLPIETRFGAYIIRANEQYRIVNDRVMATVSQKKEFNAVSGILLKDENGRDCPADAVLDAIVTTLTSTLLMEGHRHKLFDLNGVLVLPDFGKVTEDDRYKAGSTEVLGIIWHRWERAEEAHRFLGSTLVELPPTQHPDSLPESFRRVILTDGGSAF